MLNRVGCSGSFTPLGSPTAGSVPAPANVGSSVSIETVTCLDVRRQPYGQCSFPLFGCPPSCWPSCLSCFFFFRFIFPSLVCSFAFFRFLVPLFLGVQPRTIVLWQPHVRVSMFSFLPFFSFPFRWLSYMSEACLRIRTAAPPHCLVSIMSTASCLSICVRRAGDVVRLLTC